MSKIKYYDIQVDMTGSDGEEIMNWGYEENHDAELNWHYPTKQDENVVIKVKIKLEKETKR